MATPVLSEKNSPGALPLSLFVNSAINSPAFFAKLSLKIGQIIKIMSRFFRIEGEPSSVSARRQQLQPGMLLKKLGDNGKVVAHVGDHVKPAAYLQRAFALDAKIRCEQSALQMPFLP